ncbi:C-type lectin domain family 4 member A-like [Mytilus edulis]|uniref:C-type lectin domain family 4 member A-like n=1 Tax=Mytilus edulis TaxID=6550 RepID=UPI0039F061CE
MAMHLNNCYNFGGKLVELETKEENDFIKDTLTNRNADALYFLGGYKFNANDGIRWINTPGQAMTFTDYAANEPNSPTTELCLGSYRHMKFQWVDIPCNWLKSYICEFQE